MSTKWILTLTLAVVLQGPRPAPALAAQKEPADRVFEQILSMYTDLSVDKFMALAKVDKTVRDAVDFDPKEARFFAEMDQTFGFREDETERLQRDGFFVRDPMWYGGFGIAYYNIYANDLPVLVTTDSLLHALHTSYDDMLKELEADYLAAGMERVLEATREQVAAWSDEVSDNAARKSLKDADLYLTVALSLLGNERVASRLDNDETVVRILADIASLRMLVPRQDPPVVLFGEKRWVDFSQFKPRGHYTDSKELENYFRCLMWLGRADTGMNVLQSDRQLTTAALLVLAMDAARELDTLKSMDDIIGFMVGQSDNLTAFGLKELLDAMKIDSPAGLTRATRKALREAVSQGRAGVQSIRSQMVLSWPDDTVKVAPPALFQFFGQRDIIDSFVLSKVVFDSIVYKGAKQERYMPSPLDVMAALGNREAIALLEKELRAWNYSANLKAAMDFVDSHRPAFWDQSLYNLWLSALRTLDEPISGKHAPQAMQTRAWQHKQLNTQLASWAELRHDTILYAKQSYTAAAGCIYPAGYVEPYPDFYARLNVFATRAATVFAKAEFIDVASRQRYETYFKTLSKTMTTLEGLARKELSATAFSEEEQAWLKTLIRRQSSGGYGATPVYNGWYVDLFYGGADAAIEWDPEIADVHTDPNSRRVLEVGVGRINTLVIAVDNEDDLMLFAGPTLSYHEFTQPAEQRLTDPEWKDMLEQGTAPAPPAWTESFFSKAH